MKWSSYISRKEKRLMKKKKRELKKAVKKFRLFIETSNKLYNKIMRSWYGYTMISPSAKYLTIKKYVVT